MKPFACVTSKKGSNILVSDLPFLCLKVSLHHIDKHNLYINVYFRSDKDFLLQQILFLALQRTEPGGNKNQHSRYKAL